MDIEVKRLDANSELFPYELKHIPRPVKTLYCAGDLSLLLSRKVAIVGSRKFTLYGKQVTMMIASKLAGAGLSIVSGLAYGIDAFAHEATLSSGGKAIAVLGMGIDRFAPRKNKPLLDDICESGLVVSEYPRDYPGCRGAFPARNRIISGLSENVVLVEAGFKSGALITAQHALEQGREVYAVPGNINSHFSMGTNLLIRDGAKPLIIIDDLLRDMGITGRDREAVERDPELAEAEQLIYETVLKENGISVNEISQKVNIKVEQVSGILTILEIKGVITTFAGKIYLAK